MKLNPKQAPLYGECVLTVQLDDDDVCPAEEEEEVEFYLLFSGSTQRHVSSTLRVSHITLQAVCPAHNACEQVLVTLYWARPGGPVNSHSQETFCFVQDLALDMACFLLDNTAPQEALLLDDEQIHLRECERLDESLALALKHLSTPHHRTAHICSHTDADRHKCHQTHAITATDTHTHSDAGNAETHKENWMDASTLLDSCTAASHSQQLSRLLHLAASHGLRRVASFLLQQPGAQEALRKTDAKGRTAACVAESRGHQQLVELFTEYEASSGIQVKPKEELHFYPEGRVLQHHANLDTYTLTSSGCRPGEQGSEPDGLQEDVTELRRLIQIHRDSKPQQECDFAGTTAATLVSPSCGQQLLCSSRPETRQDAGLAVVTTENCSTATEEQGSPSSLDERREKEWPAVVTHTSCTRGHRCQSQEAGEGPRITPAANSPAGRNRKNKKRTTKTTRRGAQLAENRNTPAAGRGTAQGSAETTGSGPEKEGTVSAVASVLVDREATETLHSPGAQETPLPRELTSGLGGDGTCTVRKAVALPTTTVVEKQEGEVWEVDTLICERATETKTGTGIPPERQVQVTSALGPAAHNTVTMGQEHSQDPQETESDQEEPRQPDSTNKSPQSESRTSPRSPDAEQKPRRLLWRDGGWVGNAMGSPPCGPETVSKTVWYQGENSDRGSSEASQIQQANSQSVWYDSDITYEGKHEQLEQADCDLGSAQTPGLSPAQLLEQGLSPRQQCTALSQPHAAGALPTLSHGPAAQRQEVHSSQREEEVGPDWKEGGVGEEVDLTGTTYSRENCEAADIEETGEEKPAGEERGAKGRKKRRKKKGRRGGAEAKLSSSSSIESQSQSETLVHGEPATSLGPQSATEPEARDTTKRALLQSPTVSEAACREEADDDTMHLPSQTDTHNRDTHGPVCDVTASESGYTGTTDHGRTDLTEASETKESSEDLNQVLCEDLNPDSASDPSQMVVMETETTAGPQGGKETVESSDLESQGAAGPVQQTDDDKETKELAAAGEDGESVDLTDPLESKCPEELPVRHSDPTGLAEDRSPVEFPEQNTQHVQSARSAEAVALPCEGTANCSASQIREGNAEATAREYLVHCSDSETLRDRRLGGERRRVVWAGDEGEGEESASSASRRETEQSHDDNLLATAVAVVTVAIASAVVSVELSQQTAGGQSNSQQSAHDPPSAQDASALADALKQHLHSHSQATQLTSDGHTCHLSAETEDQDVHRSHPGPPEGAASSDRSEESDSEAAQLHHRELPEPAHTPSVHTEEATQNKPTPDETVTSEEDSQAHLQTGTQLSSPGVDTGQDPESSCTPCPKSDQQCQSTEVQDRDGGLPDEAPAAEDEGGGPVQEQDHPGDSDREGQTGRTESCHLSDCQAESSDSLNTPLEEKGPTETLPVGPCDSAPAADPVPDESTAPVSVETGASQSLVDNSKGPGSGAEDDEDVVCNEEQHSVDTVDGWKHREREKMEREEEARKQVVPAEDTSHTEPEPLQQQSEQTKTHADSTFPVQIQREGDVFYPVQSHLQPSPETTCAGVHADTEECVSVCVSHRDADALTVNAELDEGVFKKPDPPPCAGLRGRGVCVSRSSSDPALMEGALGLSEGAPDAAGPQSSRLSWKSETEDRGGGETEGGGEEEEKKDQLPENPVSTAILRASIRSLSPFRRHSWEPGRNNATADVDVTQRSSLKSLSGEMKRAKPLLHRRSMSWCPSNLPRPHQQQIDNRSYSLEGLEVEQGGAQTQGPGLGDQEEGTESRGFRLDSQERGSLVSLTEEEQEGDGSSIDSQTSHQVLSMTTSCPTMFHHQTLTKSISMVAISHRDVDVRGFPPSKPRISFSLSISSLQPKNRRCFSLDSTSSGEEEEGERGSSFSSNSGSLEYSISEEDPSPLRSEAEVKGGAKISRTFSYLRSKMSKKSKEKDRRGEKERESKDREKKSANSHVFILVSQSPSTSCQHCTRTLHNKDTLLCNNCGVYIHKSCRESVSVCAKSKVKQPGPEAAPGSALTTRTKSTSSASSTSSTSSSLSRERWSAVTVPDDQLTVMFPRRHPSIFNPHSNLAKSISTSNIAGLDDVPLRGLKFLSQSTDSLHQGSKVNASTESLTDEGTEMMDNQLMGEFECDIKDLEADSWSSSVDKKFLKTLKKDEIKRQDVIYELYQTEIHHVRTLKIMSEVYYKGLQREVQLETDILDKIFPVLDDLLHTHTDFLSRLLETKRASSISGQNNSNFLICRIGDVLVQQFSDCSAERMKKIYGKFCSRHNEAVNLYKDLQAKDKRFQAFIKRTMSSSIVRRLSIPECILLVTQRITKYPVLIQRILQHTKDSDGDHSGVCESLRCVKALIAAVDSKVNEQEKKRRLREVHSRTDSKSIMRMKSGQMFAKEDLIRGRKLLHDGALQLKNSAGRLKDVRALLLSDVLVFLQEKDQKYVFASLDQRSTVISLQNLIVREVANEERGLFLITAGTERPEMVEVLASSKEERNTWRAIIQDAMHCMEKDEDEGVPSETEEDRRQQESRAKETRELLQKKDEQIICLLEEKIHIFRELGDGSHVPEDTTSPVRERMMFRATADDVTKGEPIIQDALREVETLHTLVSSGVGGAGCSAPAGLTGGSVGPVCLPRRAETFGGFDSHQMNSSKNGDKEEGEESLDLRRTESDSVLKKGATASLQMLLKRNNEQVQHSVIHLHDLLISLQAVVVQQDSFVEDQRQTLNDRLTANSSRHSSSSSLSSSSSSRPSSLVEQEKHRSLERQRQEAASLQKQQAAYQEEKRKREKEWELKERVLAEREERLREVEEETKRRHHGLQRERETLQKKKEEYQKELERLREAQRRLERDTETLRRDSERLETMRTDQDQLQMYQRTPSTTSEDSIRLWVSGSDLDLRETAEQSKEVELSSSAPTKEPFLRIGSKRMGKNFNPFSSSSSSSSTSSKPQGAEKESQIPTRLLQLAKPKEKKDKKKKGKGGEQTQTENKMTMMSDSQKDGDIFFC